MRKWNKWLLVLIAIIFGLSLWYVWPTSSGGSANRDLTLSPSNGTISGTVTDLSSGNLVPSLEVKLIKDGGDPTTVNTDDSGKFSFASLKPGSYKLEIVRADYDDILYSTDIKPGDTIDLSLNSIPSTMAIKGDVRNSLSGEPVVGVVITLLEKTSTETPTETPVETPTPTPTETPATTPAETTNVTTDALGRYGFAVTLPGTYTLTITDSNYQTLEPVTIEYAGTPITQPVTIEPKPGQINGSVSTLTGSLLSNATLILTKDDVQVSSATSDASGSYSFADVAQGDYTLIITQGAYLEKKLPLQVLANQTVKQDVSLSPPNISVEGLVVDSASKSPIAGAMISVRKTPKGTETSDIMYSTLTDEQGHYALGGLPHGMSLTIAASKSGYKNLVSSSKKITFSTKGFHFGLDLKGGSQIVLKADFEAANIADEDKSGAMSGAVNIIEKRINGYGVSDPVVQKVGSDRILVELPGVKNTDEAVNLIGQTATLEFKVQKLDATGNPVLDANGDYIWEVATGTGSDGQPIELTGKYFKSNVHWVVNTDTASDNYNQPEVAFEWKSEAAPAFEEVTGRLVTGNQPLGIFLDNKLISAPRVQAVIKDKGVITGLSLNEAKNLVTQLKSGSLPVPLKVVERHDVDPTLGPNVIKKCLIAGALALLAIFLFMTIYYRLPGLLSGGALIVYVTVVMAIFKVIPVTLTLAGIGGFIVSIGMAVDANCIIFERLKEELRAGRALGPASDIAFNRAWPAIRDSNFTTFIACGILYWLGSTLGVHPVQGFAITLFFGVAVSMISAIIMTHAFVRAFVFRSWANKPWLYLGMGEKSNV